jgi:glycerol uptake facilitator protein
MFAILGLSQVNGMVGAQGNILVFCIIVSIGMSLGGLTGYAINPARDLGPRLAHWVLPMKNKADSNWSYGIVTLVCPIIGALIALGLFKIIPWAPLTF